MLTFKDFLIEAPIDKKPKYYKVDTEKALAILNEHCKNALWMLSENTPIYRGSRSAVVGRSGFSVVNTETTKRRSQNTSNYYTVILDNHPNRQDFPKRSRSFVASMDKSYASGYGYGTSGGLYVIIPSDDAKIGVVGHQDMWYTWIKLFGKKCMIESANNFFKYLKLAADIKDIKKFDEKLKRGDTKSIKALKAAMKEYNMIDPNAQDKFLEKIWEAYSAKETKHKWYYTSNMPSSVKGEVWVSGKCVLISIHMWNQIREAYKQQHTKPKS